jgi:6-phosphogluconolactonase
MMNECKGRIEWIHCGSNLELARRAADRWLARGGDKPSCVALSGGRITRGFFDAVVTRAGLLGMGALAVTEFFWADERCVRPDDPDSNYRLAKERLLEPLRIEPGRIHRLAGELDPDEAAEKAEADLRRVTRVERNGLPVLDLVFLGMGEDGHVASLFPDAPEPGVGSQAVYLAVTGPKPPPRRLTLTYPMLAEACEVWVLISGAGKEEALARSLARGGETPLGRVIRSRHNAVIFSDLDMGRVEDLEMPSSGPKLDPQGH